jgi:hypothetical protein
VDEKKFRKRFELRAVKGILTIAIVSFPLKIMQENNF